MKKILLTVLIASLFGCKAKMDDTIKKGYFDSCRKYNVETLINGFFANPKWESFISPDDDKYHLNVSGQIMYDNAPANAIVQFEIHDDERWQINAFEINGEPQEDFMIAGLVDEMCVEASN
jgi:hypothetical protein